MIEEFDSEVDNFKIEPLTGLVVEEAENLLFVYGNKHGLRTLDALHLGAFNLIADDDSYFVSSDSNLCKIATLNNNNVINPQDDDFLI